MFVTKKRYDQMKKSGDDLLAQRAANAVRDAETIGRLQRENARLLGEASQLRSDMTAAEMAYEESRKGHARVAAELATLKAERERRMAPLIAANEARRAKAKAKKVVA
ncbi:hypothetical protein [Sphingobium sp. YR768]|uniref:hypothetical protein n=1 Tax=Sphingobium sp. YR768 TaxID=1884365 RepID=UPI0008C38A88|nr:hypothetical protein [Sphingobium sp. YR768]SES07858.1 hypothetical protein SAMN05518866_1373 [Sphingobium sp. YR768]